MVNSGYLFYVFLINSDQKLYWFNQCGATDTCSNWVARSTPNFSFSGVRTIHLTNCTTGLNRYAFTSFFFARKGSMIAINQSNPILAVQTDDPFTVSDYIINWSSSFKINKNQNWRYYVNIEAERFYYKIIYPITLNYNQLINESFGIYNLTASLSYSTVSITRSFNVTNCKFYTYYKLNNLINDLNVESNFFKVKFLDMVCSLSKIGSVLNCTFEIASQSQNEALIISFGDGYTQNIQIQGRYLIEFSENLLEFFVKFKKIIAPLPFLSYFGPNILNSSIFNTNLLHANGSYILTNTEFMFHAELYGFTVHAVSAGTITINVEFFCIFGDFPDNPY